jgi:hypothetical protein
MYLWLSKHALNLETSYGRCSGPLLISPGFARQDFRSLDVALADSHDCQSWQLCQENAVCL